MVKKVEFKNGIEFVDIDKVKPTEINPNFVPPQIEDSLKNNIEKNGFYGAILVDKNYVIVDGEHRWRALKKLGSKIIPVTMDKELDDFTRKIQTLRLNREHGYLTPIESGTLLEQLSKEVPNDILQKLTSIPLQEMNLLMNLHYNPKLDSEQIKKSTVTWAIVEKLVSKVTNQLPKDINQIMAVGRGGMIPARLIADKLDIKKITLIDEKIPKIQKGCLIVDDIFDSGKTFKRIITKEVPKEIKFVTLLLRIGKSPPVNLVYGAITEDESYIIFPWDKVEFKRSLKEK